MAVLKFTAEEEIIQKGEPATFFGIILDGKFEVSFVAGAGLKCPQNISCLAG